MFNAFEQIHESHVRLKKWSRENSEVTTDKSKSK